MTALTGNGIVVLGIFALNEDSLPEASARPDDDFNASILDLVIVKSDEVLLFKGQDSIPSSSEVVN